MRKGGATLRSCHNSELRHDLLQIGNDGGFVMLDLTARAPTEAEVHAEEDEKGAPKLGF